MKAAKCRAVLLDRDGVLNRAVVRNGKPYPPATVAELQVMPDASDALAALQAAGFLLVGVTNQPDVARGIQQRAVVEAINAVLLRRLPLRDILVCYHDDGDGCACRKPLPGLLHQVATQYAADLPTSFMVGDRWKDVEAGRRAGCRTVLIDYAYEETKLTHQPDYTTSSLTDAARWIISNQESR